MFWLRVVVAFGAYLTLLKRVGGGPSAYVAVSTPVVALAPATQYNQGMLEVLLPLPSDLWALNPALAQAPLQGW